MTVGAIVPKVVDFVGNAHVAYLEGGGLATYGTWEQAEHGLGIHAMNGWEPANRANKARFWRCSPLELDVARAIEVIHVGTSTVALGVRVDRASPEEWRVEGIEDHAGFPRWLLADEACRAVVAIASGVRSRF